MIGQSSAYRLGNTTIYSDGAPGSSSYSDYIKQISNVLGVKDIWAKTPAKLGWGQGMVDKHFITNPKTTTPKLRGGLYNRTRAIDGNDNIHIALNPNQPNAFYEEYAHAFDDILAAPLSRKNLKPQLNLQGEENTEFGVVKPEVYNNKSLFATDLDKWALETSITGFGGIKGAEEYSQMMQSHSRNFAPFYKGVRDSQYAKIMNNLSSSDYPTSLKEAIADAVSESLSREEYDHIERVKTNSAINIWRQGSVPKFLSTLTPDMDAANKHWKYRYNPQEALGDTLGKAFESMTDSKLTSNKGSIPKFLIVKPKSYLDVDVKARHLINEAGLNWKYIQQQ